MNKKMTYFETGSHNPHYNLAFEEYVLTHRMEGDHLILWQNDNTIVIGQNQNAEEEINREFVEKHHIHVVRRATGGGAVYHDLGNLNYSFITDASVEKLAFKRFTEPIVAALQGLGLCAEASGRNDILVEGRKVSGTAQRLHHDRILHHGTLLFDSDPSMVAGALRVDPTKFQSKSSKSVRSRIGNIRDFLLSDMDITAFWEYLKKALVGSGLEPMQLTPDELAAVETLKEETYDTWAWTFGNSLRYDVTNRQRFENGLLESTVAVEKGYITQIGFYGDFLSARSLEPLTNALVGRAFRREAVAEVLEHFDLYPFFGGIPQEEVLDTLFYANS